MCIYLAIFTHFFCDFDSFFFVFFAHPINPKGQVVFYIFQGLTHTFKDDFTKFQDHSRTKGSFFQIPGVFQDQGQIPGVFRSVGTLD